ncbi:hypothetical protein BCR39DRAFT_545596 [Naematelia encephala]|uniref:Uncharacterized protein n=1 Tax=Naematelia encephala TaxID=71784 RepID=A0A1Y2AQV9_9TREE|nr:hypothetical protein BCR39DRAFT_545596 [Naematelia encephala]
MVSPLDQPETPASTSSPAPRSQVDDNPSQSQPLAIEAPSAVIPEQKQEQQEEVHSLDVGDGTVVKLDKLGPMIVNSDGTLSRIQNWQELHPIEQERTVRLLVKKRNLVRLQKLEAEDKGVDGQDKLSALKEAEAGGTTE